MKGVKSMRNRFRALLGDQKQQNVVFLAVFLLTGLFLFWKCHFGFGNIDESFYLTIPYRLIQGDSLFQEEWHLSQMAGILTMPLVSAYLAIKGSTEGIILAMRYAFTAIHCLTAVFLYTRLKKISWLGALLASVSYLLYTPFGVMALSYNSMGIMFLVISSVILLTAGNGRVEYVLAGLSFAAAVLCCPYLVLVYALYMAAIAVSYFRKRSREHLKAAAAAELRAALYVTAGAAMAALLFAVFVLSRGSLEGIIRSFPPMMDDPEHQETPPFFKTLVYLRSVFCVNAWSPCIYGALFAVGLAYLMDKKREKHRDIYICMISAAVLVLMYSMYRLNHFINYQMWSVNVYAVFILLITKDPQIRKLFYYVWVPGILYSVCLNMASNQSSLAITSASAVASVGSMVMIGLFLVKLFEEDSGTAARKLAVGMICGVVALQITSQTIMRYESVFWDDGMEQMEMRITDGIEKGIITSETSYYNYYYYLEQLEQVEEYHGENVLYLSENTWFYLQGKGRMSTYSAWLSGVNEHTLDRLAVYYDINPHKLPDAVYVSTKDEAVAEQFCERFSYYPEQINGAMVLLPQ